MDLNLINKMQIEKYKKKYPFLKCLDIMKKVRKRKDLLLWRTEYYKWDVRHFEDIQRIEKGEEPKMLVEYIPNSTNSSYYYFIDGQQEELYEIALELEMQPQSVINQLLKYNNKWVKNGLTITRIKKDEQ